MSAGGNGRSESASGHNRVKRGSQGSLEMVATFEKRPPKGVKKPLDPLPAEPWRAPSPTGPSGAGPRCRRPAARPSPGRHCHSTLLLTVIDYHSLGVYTPTRAGCHCFRFQLKRQCRPRASATRAPRRMSGLIQSNQNQAWGEESTSASRTIPHTALHKIKENTALGQ